MKKAPATLLDTIDSLLYTSTRYDEDTLLYTGKTSKQLAIFLDESLDAIESAIETSTDLAFEERTGTFYSITKAMEIQVDRKNAKDKVDEARKNVLLQSVSAARSTFERFDKKVEELEDLRDEAIRNINDVEAEINETGTGIAIWDIRDYLSNLTDAIDKAMNDLA